MNIIFCLSYLSFFQTIFLVEKHGSKNVKVVTSNENIKKLFSLAYGDDIVWFIESRSMLLPKNFHQFFLFPFRIIDVIIKKCKTWTTFRKVENSNIYFFFNAAGFFQAWLINKLSKKNKLFYEEDLKLDSFKLAKTRRAKLNTWFIRKIYGEEVLALDQKTVVNYKMSDQFLKKCDVKHIEIKYKFANITKIISSKLKLPKGEILFLPPLLDESKINKSTYVEEVDSFISECQKKNIDIHLKSHPRSTEKYSQENQLFEIPIYYPANCLINYKLTVGVNSATLFELANAGCLSISLIKLVMNKNLITTTIKFLNNNLDEGKQIIYPENITELMHIISNYTNLDE